MIPVVSGPEAARQLRRRRHQCRLVQFGELALPNSAGGRDDLLGGVGAVHKRRHLVGQLPLAFAGERPFGHRTLQCLDLGPAQEGEHFEPVRRRRRPPC